MNKFLLIACFAFLQIASANVPKNPEFEYHKPFELHIVYVRFYEDQIEEYCPSLDKWNPDRIKTAALSYQLWPKGTSPTWENNTMIYVTCLKDKSLDGTWWTEDGFKKYMMEMIRINYPSKRIDRVELHSITKLKEVYPTRTTYLK